MTDKEFKRLGRAQLIEIIYRLQLQIEELTEKNASLESDLEDKRVRIDNAGDIAKAALEMNDCFRSAQNAADQYLSEIKLMREEAEAEKKKIIEDAKAEAEKIIAKAKKEDKDYEAIISAILTEYDSRRADDR